MYHGKVSRVFFIYGCVKINYIRFEKLACIIIVIDKWEEDNI